MDHAKKSPVGHKIKKLKKKGKSQKQAVAFALSMRRKKKLGPKGGYKK
jgi:hypothetical protein